MVMHKRCNFENVWKSSGENVSFKSDRRAWCSTNDATYEMCVHPWAVIWVLRKSTRSWRCEHDSSCKMCENSQEIMTVLINTDESTVGFEENFDRDFSRESLCENAENASEQRSSRIPVIATFQENPCARMQKMYPSNGRPGPLSSPLFKRIPVRELKQQKSKNCYLDFCWESWDENHDNKRPGLKGNRFPCI